MSQTVGNRVPSQAVRLILIRHGETDWNVEGRYQGQADPPLNARGEVQAQALAERLTADGVRPVGIYASPLRRAWRTAEVLAQRLGVPLWAEPRLQEIHLGAWQGVLAKDIARRWPDLFQRWQTEPWAVRPPGGETMAEVQARVHAAVDDILSRHPGQTVALVAHRLPLLLIKLRYQDLDPQAVHHLPLPNADYEALAVYPDGRAETLRRMRPTDASPSARAL